MLHLAHNTSMPQSRFHLLHCLGHSVHCLAYGKGQWDDSVSCPYYHFYFKGIAKMWCALMLCIKQWVHTKAEWLVKAEKKEEVRPLVSYTKLSGHHGLNCTVLWDESSWSEWLWSMPCFVTSTDNVFYLIQTLSQLCHWCIPLLGPVPVVIKWPKMCWSHSNELSSPYVSACVVYEKKALHGSIKWQLWNV